MHQRALRILAIEYQGDPTGYRLMTLVDTKPEMTIERHNDSTTYHSRCRTSPLDGRSLCLDPVPLEMLTNLIKAYTMLVRPGAEHDDVHNQSDPGRSGRAGGHIDRLAIGLSFAL